MSLTPSTPNLNLKDRAFWTKPDSVAGWVLLAAAAGAGIFFWGSIVPFLLSMMVDTMHLVWLGIEASVLGYVLFSKRTHMLFRLLSRSITNLIIPVFPIEILKDKIAQMKTRRQVMEEQISKVSGQVRLLKDTIVKNAQQAAQQYQQADYAKRHVADAKDQTEALRMQLAMKTKANKAGRLENANLGYQQLLVKLTAIYDMLTKWSIHVDAYIEDTEDSVRQEEIRYNVINAAYRAYRTALSVVKGNVTEEDIYNTTLEYLADEAGRKLGEMEDFQRVAQGFMDNLDIQNGVVTEDALSKLNDYQQKVLTSGSQDTAFLVGGAKPASVPVMAGAPGTGSSWDDLIHT